MNRTLVYTIPEEFHQKKLSDFLQSQGYSSKILTKLRHTEGSLFLEKANDDQTSENSAKISLGEMRASHAKQEVHMNHLGEQGDTLTIYVREEDIAEKILPMELPFPICYEDEDLVVVNKPAGMPIHPSIRHYENTLANAAAYYFQKESSSFVYRCMNRLDKDTTGLTILAKNPLAGTLLQEQMRSNQIRRIYTALVEGSLTQKEGTICLPIARKGESIIERVVDEVHGEKAITHYQVVEERMLHATPNVQSISMVKLTLETGRTHQIRVHMKALGHPLLGDYIYNEKPDALLKRQALHAGELYFRQPITRENIHLVAPLPGDMEECWTKAIPIGTIMR